MQNLKKLVSIASNTDKEEIINFVAQELESKAKEIQIIKNKENNNKSIIFGIITNLKDCAPIVLSGHLDTVDPDFKLYKTNPFILTQKGDKFYGLGSIDMKSFMAIIMDIFNDLQNFSYPIIGCFTTDEETNVYCINNVINFLKKKNITPIFTIVGEPTNSFFSTVCNGCAEYVTTFIGKACHSSIPYNGVNAISACAKFVNYINRIQKNYSNLTSNVGIINGGEVSNKVPDFSTITFDLRTTQKTSQDKFLKMLEKYLKKLETEFVGLKTQLSCNLCMPPLFNKNSQKIKKIGQDLNIQMGTFTGGCEAGYFTDYSGDAIIFGVDKLSLAHKPNEYVEKSEYETYKQKLMQTINAVIKEYDSQNSN